MQITTYVLCKIKILKYDSGLEKVGGKKSKSWLEVTKNDQLN